MNNFDEDMEKLDGFFNKGWNCDLDEIHSIVANIAKELKTYKKIAEKLAEYIETKNYADDICEFRLDVKGRFHKHCYKGECKQCIIDWARKEVENENMGL